VDVSTDAGRSWSEAEIQGTAHRMAHTRFRLPWSWDGQETVLMSRCTDEVGQVQPTQAQVAAHFGEPGNPSRGVPGLDNTIQPWRVAGDGSVSNGRA
jgi:sulfane dehydrogenase subunit SoxC